MATTTSCIDSRQLSIAPHHFEKAERVPHGMNLAHLDGKDGWDGKDGVVSKGRVAPVLPPPDQFTPKLGPLADSMKLDADNLQNLITNFDNVGKGADTVLGTADRFIGGTDKQLQEQLKQLHVTLLNLKVVTTYAKALLETLAQKPNRIIFSGKPATLTPESEILKSSKPMPARKP